MRSLLDFEDLNKAVISGSVIGVDVAEDEFHSVLIDEALDQSVEVVLVKGAISTIGFAHHVDRTNGVSDASAPVLSYMTLTGQL